MSATVSFSPTEKLRSWTARNPPNRLLRLRIMSASTIERCLFGWRSVNDVLVCLGQDAEQPGRPPQDHGDQDQAVNGQLNAAQSTAEPALQQRGRRLQQDGAEHRAPQ